ncbi:MAG: hypothetical protein IJB86_10515 [Clostridia bacterium]|nr:hypothetical protein [Clostridia bacterium]
MAEKRYLLGIDGGGSKTTAVVFDESGRFIASAVGESINYYSNPLEVTRNNLSLILKEIEDKCGVKCYASAFIGMSALNDRASERELKAFADGVINADKTEMDSDLFVALESMNTEGLCAVGICGTGSMAVARNKDGKIVHKGGFGYILGDEGSGYEISLNAVKSAVRAAEGCEAPTLLTEKALSFFNVRDVYELIDIFYDPPIERQRIAAFMPCVRECAEGGDATAIRHINNSADAFSDTMIALLKETGDSVSVGLWGGVFCYCEMFRNRFIGNLKKQGYCDVSLLQFPPEIGAIFAACKDCGIEVTEEFKNNVKATYLN